MSRISLAAVLMLALTTTAWGADIAKKRMGAAHADEIIVAPGPDAEYPCLVSWYSIAPDGQMIRLNLIDPYNGSTHGGRVAGGHFFNAGD